MVMDEITAKNVKTAIELDHKHDASASKLVLLAGKVSRFAGSVSFIIWHLAIFSAWMGFNYFMKDNGFDPYPFTFLTLTVSLESIILSSLLLISQNRISNQQDRRHQLDLQINLLSEQENTMMLRVLDRIAKKLDVDSSELKDFISDVKPEEVLEALEDQEKIKGV